jgi:23S rRNA pseudouridine2604 synthase
MKIDKYIGQTGFTSRRKASELIEAKRVLVNTKIANFSTKVNEGDTVTIDGQVLKMPKNIPTYIAYHKPKGIICTTEKIQGNIIDAINHTEKIYPVGRLDKDSEGLILLTNHGELNDRITNPRYEHEKEYIVTLNLPLRKKFLDDISTGITIQNETTKACKVTAEPNTKRIFRIVLTQGLNRQIRRMCNAYDYQVIKLQRVRIMNIALDKLKPGEWRNLTEHELKPLLAMLHDKELKPEPIAQQKTNTVKLKVEKPIKKEQNFKPTEYTGKKEIAPKLQIKSKLFFVEAMKGKNKQSTKTKAGELKKAKPRRKTKPRGIGKSGLQANDLGD